MCIRNLGSFEQKMVGQNKAQQILKERYYDALLKHGPVPGHFHICSHNGDHQSRCVLTTFL